jgi:hypothetical protein
MELMDPRGWIWVETKGTGVPPDASAAWSCTTTTMKAAAAAMVTPTAGQRSAGREVEEGGRRAQVRACVALAAAKWRGAGRRGRRKRNYVRKQREKRAGGG